MSYFIFKNIHSEDMPIIVQKLPPVSKPPKRYDLIEVEGSDRTKIEILGYKAYEKPILIGFKNSQLDKVYDWLDESGRLVLSNEPDKYYEACILEQIDYERALRFRTANIPFIVQPYKISLEDENTQSKIVYNRGNTDSLPIMTLYGSGPVTLLINGIEACRFLSINEFVTIDSEELEAYKGAILQNRNMIGEFPKLRPGTNVISCTGNVTKINTLVRSRWT